MLLNQVLRSHRAGVARRGLTLLELVVVMVILAALAGILVPLLPNLARKGHTSAGATNLGEIAKAIQLYASQNGDSFPNNYDSIVNADGAIATYVPTVSAMFGGQPVLTVGNLTSTEVSRLSDVGITTIVQMIEQPANPGSWSPTFFPYGTAPATPPTPVTLATSTNVALLNPAVAAAKFALPNDGKYVVFGIGKYCTAVSTVMNEAPVWYSPVQDMDPASKYARFGLVFQLAGAGGATLSRAKFVGPVEFGPWGTMTKDDNLGYHYTLD
ncbi:MAG: type II secretion system GspH family protein [Pirellulaceae bacterium]|nr:type II secretion system GspH family protein [Pirellulaceae bacterium]